jgi:hypothetical protein
MQIRVETGVLLNLFIRKKSGRQMGVSTKLFNEMKEI